MKKKSAVILLLVFIIGCQQQEDNPYPIVEDTSVSPYLLTRSMGNFFDTDGTDGHLQSIINYLQFYNETHSFTPSFIEYYGYPLWREVYNFTLGDYGVYIVPVLKDAEIGTLWIFEMDTFQTRHYIFPRPAKDDPDYSLSWMFDYFNVTLSLRDTNDEGEIVAFTPPAQPRGLIIEYCNYIWTGYKDSSGVEHLEYRGKHCWNEYIEQTTTPIIDTGGAGLNLGNNGGSTGGGGGGILPIGSLFTSTDSLDEEGKKKLEMAVFEMLKNCYAEAIYNHLLSKNVRFSKVTIDPNISGEVQFSFTNHNLTFRDSEFIDGGALYHEMFHLFQKFVNPSASTLEMRGLMEYERTLFEDIAFMIKYADKKGKIKRDDWSKRKSPWVYSPMKGDKREQDKYIDWIMSKTKKFKTYPESISKEDFSLWKSLFKKYTNSSYREYDYTVSYDHAAINTAFGLAKKNNCGK